MASVTQEHSDQSLENRAWQWNGCLLFLHLLFWLGATFPDLLWWIISPLLSDHHALCKADLTPGSQGGSAGCSITWASDWLIDGHLIKSGQSGPELGLEPRQFGTGTMTQTTALALFPTYCAFWTENWRMSNRIKTADKAGGNNVMRLQMFSGPDCRCLADLGKNPILNSILRAMETFPGGTVVKNPPAIAGNRRDMDSIPRLGKSPRERNSNLLQYSCLENSMD